MQDPSPETPEIMSPGTGTGADALGGEKGGDPSTGPSYKGAFSAALNARANPAVVLSALRNRGKGGFGARHFLLGAGIALLALVLMLVAVVIGLLVALLVRLGRPFGLMKRRRPVDTAPAIEARPTARGWVTD